MLCYPILLWKVENLDCRDSWAMTRLDPSLCRWYHLYQCHVDLSCTDATRLVEFESPPCMQCSAVPGFPSQEYIISSATAESHNGRLSVTNYFRNHKLTDGGPYTSCSGFRCRFFSCPVAPDDGRDTSSVAWSKPRPALKTLPHFVNRVHARTHDRGYLGRTC